MNKPQVFISYNREDGDWARQLAYQLMRVGVEPWIDAFALQAGDDLSAQLGKALSESDAFAFVIGNGDPAKNSNQFFEMGVATASGRPIIPIFLEPSAHRKLPTSFSHFVHLNTNQPDEAARRIAEIACQLAPAA